MRICSTIVSYIMGRSLFYIFLTGCVLVGCLEAKTTKAPKKSDKRVRQENISPELKCSKQSFAAQGECCKDLPVDFFPQETRYECYSSGDIIAFMAVSRQYILNRYQTGSQYALKISSSDTSKQDKTAGRKLGDLKCHANCLFAFANLASGNTLKYDSMAAYFANATQNSATSVLVANAVTKCNKIVPAVLSTLTADDEDGCPQAALVYVQCIWKEVLLNCTVPAIPDTPKRNGGFRPFAEECASKQKTLRLCDRLVAP